MIIEYIKGCTGKQAYDNSDLAMTVLRKMNKNKPNDGKLRIYRCSHCNKFHIGGFLKLEHKK